MTAGGVIAAVAWPVILGGLAVLSFRAWLRERREWQRMHRLLAVGDSAWVADEDSLWVLGVDPCPDFDETDELAGGVEAYCGWLDSLLVWEPNRRLAS